MALTTESSTPPRAHGTAVHVSFLVDHATEVRVTDAHHPRQDIVALYFDSDDGRICIQGDLVTMQRWVDDAAHQLMIVSAARCQAEEERAHAKAHVARLREVIATERAEARAAQ